MSQTQVIPTPKVVAKNGITVSRSLVSSLDAFGGIELPIVQVNPTFPRFISPEIAAVILEQWAYHGQRNLRPLEVARYARMMQLGRFNEHEIRVCILGKKFYVTDGQHRLHGVVMSGVGQTFNVKEIICHNEKEVADDYNSSGGGIPRTQADELRATGIEQRLEVNKNHYHSYAAAVKVILTEFTFPSKYLNAKDSQDLEQGMVEFQRVHSLYIDACKGADTPLPKILKWAGVKAVGMMTFQVDQARADTFWRSLASGQTIYPAIQMLSVDLAKESNGKRPSQIHMARVVAFYWARFNKSPFVKPKQRHYQGVDEPIFIHGSDKYNGRQELDPAQMTLNVRGL